MIYLPISRKNYNKTVRRIKDLNTTEESKQEYKKEIMFDDRNAGITVLRYFLIQELEDFFCFFWITQRMIYLIDMNRQYLSSRPKVSFYEGKPQSLMLVNIWI